MQADRIIWSDLQKEDRSEDTFKNILEKVNGGAVFVYPTETVYGLGGITTDEVREKIYAIKNRGKSNPLIIVAGRQEQFSKFNLEMNKSARWLAQQFWPGKITLILPVTNSDETIGVRISDHPFIQYFSDHCDWPLFSTSANISGEEYCGEPDYLYSLFENKVDLMIDYGVLPQSPPSTVVDVTNEGAIRVLREGVVSIKELFSSLNKMD